jgi:hypothetical protein
MRVMSEIMVSAFVALAIASGGTPGIGATAEMQKATLTPEQQMQARFPQPVRTGDLIGLPLLDWYDQTIGYVREVVRGPNGKISLIVPYAKRFGWVRFDCLVPWRRLVAVPIEVVAILGRQIDSLDMVPDDFDKAPAWMPGDGKAIPDDEIIRIAVARR